jgi:antirestriction protein
MTEKQQKEIDLLKELIADSSIANDEREIFKKTLTTLLSQSGSEEPKVAKKMMPKKEKATPKTKATKKPKANKPAQLPSDVEAMKKQIKERTGKTEAECEDIISQYRMLRNKAKVNGAKRIAKLKGSDDLIAGTNVITPVAQIEKDAEIVKAKIEKQVEQIENKAEREVVKKDKTKDEVKVAVEKKVVKELAKLSDDMLSKSTTFVKNIQTELKKVDKTEAKNFLLGLRNEIDALLSKFGDGGTTQIYNIAEMNSSSSSVNPSKFARGGGIMADGRIILRTFNGIGISKDKTYNLIKDDRDSDGKPYYTLMEIETGKVFAQGDSFEEINHYANLFSGKNIEYARGGGVDKLPSKLQNRLNIVNSILQNSFGRKLTTKEAIRWNIDNNSQSGFNAGQKAIYLVDGDESQFYDSYYNIIGDALIDISEKMTGVTYDLSDTEIEKYLQGKGDKQTKTQKETALKYSQNNKFADGGGVGEWSVSDISNAKYLGVIEFQDMNEEFHNFELMETDDRIVFGGMSNTGFIESGYIEKDGFSTDEVLQELISDLEVYYNDGGQYTSNIVFNQRMAKGGLIGNQKRIDLNENGKIDAEDFKLLRSTRNGAWRKEHKYVNSTSRNKKGKLNKSEVRYAKKNNPSRTGYKGKSNYARGGGIGEKKYYMQFNVGKAKYVINYYDGIKKHKDGSEFYDIATFNNKRDLDEFQRKLMKDGYKYSYAGGGDIMGIESKGLVEKAKNRTGKWIFSVTYADIIDGKKVFRNFPNYVSEYFNSKMEAEKSLQEKLSKEKQYAMGGGIEDSPSIYVADLEAYNDGRLNGEWLKLTDYNNADELMEAIQELLDKWGVEEYAIHDTEYIPSNLSSEYMGQKDFEQLYEMIDLANEYNLPLEVVQDVVSQYDASAVEEYQGKYDNAIDFAEQLVDETGIESFIDFQQYLDISDTDRRLLANDFADSYVDDIKNEDGGNRVIEEAGLDVSDFENADSNTQDEMLDEAVEIVREEYYNTWYDGLDDPYYFLVEEQGLYSADDFAKANFVRIDYDKLADALEQDYTFIYDSNNDLYVFNIR